MRMAGRCVLVIFMLVLSACSDPPVTSIRMGLASAPINLDPRYATDATSERINRLLYRQLVDFDDQFSPAPSLARWEIVSPLHYRVTLLKQGRGFVDGTRLTANDVKATYDSILDPQRQSPHRSNLAIIKHIEVVNNNVVDFILHKPDTLFPGRLVIGIVPEKLIQAQHDFSHAPIGSGAFKLASWPDTGVLNLIRRHDGQQFSFVHVADPTVRVLKLVRGEIDILQNDIPPELVSYLKQQKDMRIDTGKGSNFTYLGLNMSDPVLQTPAVRQAIAYAINRKEIIDKVWRGMARPASALLPPEHWSGYHGGKHNAYDIQQATQLLKQAGYDIQHPLHLVYKTSSDPFRLRLATIFQHQLKQVGIELEIRSYDWGTFYGDIKAGNFQLYSLSWVGIKSPDVFHYVFHSESLPPAGANRGRYRNPTLDRLIEKALVAPEKGTQVQLFQQVQTLLAEDLPYIPLWFEHQMAAMRSDIEGYALAVDGNYDSLIEVRRRTSTKPLNTAYVR